MSTIDGAYLRDIRKSVFIALYRRDNENSRQRFTKREGIQTGRVSAHGGRGGPRRAEAERSPRDVTSGTERRAVIGRASRCFLFQ